MPNFINNLAQCVEHIIEARGKNLIVGAPLGIGKPNPVVNAIWQRAKTDNSIQLEVFTALSLQVPKGKSLLEKRFLQPFTDRQFGKNYPDLDYIEDVIDNNLPENMKLTEFYMQSGKMLTSSTAQRNYTSSNYTHAARDMIDKGINVLVQMVAVKQTENGVLYSLSSNTDLTLDVVAICQRKNKPIPFMLAMVNPNMPFMGGNAEVSADFFDAIVDNESLYYLPFAPPRSAVNMVDYHIGLLASCLIKDGGTLQVGIGSLGDALVYATQLRHENNANYGHILKQLEIEAKFEQIYAEIGDTGEFKQGLYAASEMFVEGFAHLYESNILKRRVYPDAQIQSLLNQGIISEKIPANIIEILIQNNVLDEFITKKQLLRLQHLGILKRQLHMLDGEIVDESGKHYQTNLFDYANIQAIQHNCLGENLQQGAVLHAAFFLGSTWFYDWLRQLDDKQRRLFQMTAVSQVNELYGSEALDRVQRVNARFINTCMKVDVLGAAASDTLDNNQVVSGVGGQYNFVAMAHALENSRSILMLRSTHKGKESNIVWKYPYCTIPRHLRDIVITEYGIADLRGQSDEECIKRMICIADSRFQQSLRAEAVKYFKLDAAWQVPVSFQSNTSAHLKQKFKQLKQQGFFPEYPFGSDFTEEELRLIKALGYLKANSQSTWAKIKLISKAVLSKLKASEEEKYLQRMDLVKPINLQEKINKKLLVYALKQIGI